MNKVYDIVCCPLLATLYPRYICYYPVKIQSTDLSANYDTQAFFCFLHQAELCSLLATHPLLHSIFEVVGEDTVSRFTDHCKDKKNIITGPKHLAFTLLSDYLSIELGNYIALMQYNENNK